MSDEQKARKDIEEMLKGFEVIVIEGGTVKKMTIDKALDHIVELAKEHKEPVSKDLYQCSYCGAVDECPYAWDAYNIERNKEDAENHVNICLGLK